MIPAHRPVSGVLDTAGGHHTLRVDGYLPSTADVTLSAGQVRRSGLRRGDLVTGTVTGESRPGRPVPLDRLDTVNGLAAGPARRRRDFHQLTPVHPRERLRLETEPHVLTTRVVDLVMPIGKGQRALVVAPPKAGKTMVLQAIANAITSNHPDCHLMVVLVDERPEEVTDMSRSIKGEVVAATFDRPPRDHTAVAELAIERAKRLVELGQDVVVLLDSLTRLGRAYNLTVRSAGRTLSGGIDVAALTPPKQLLAAARAVEEGGSLTILATALVENGSAADTLIFEEFKSTGNAELKLDRGLADRRTFPAVDVRASGTRREEALLSDLERQRLRALRSALSTLDRQSALEHLLRQLGATGGNAHLLARLGATGR